MQVLDGIDCHLATAKLPKVKKAGALLSDQTPSLQTFALYGKRFGGIEPHLKDYKSSAFGVLQSGFRNPQALIFLFMLLDCASLIALMIGMMVVQAGHRLRLIGTLPGV
ncbi:MAG: hypothetical protein B0A82_01420 [Alkalinema sp. CACIAM 70d]|nr:MAG: hypothetical protein B0A82_01420 [Alkalinema sp. CACIAM 70d]